MTEATVTTQRVRYLGARSCTDGTLAHFYRRTGGTDPDNGKELTFKKRLPGWHRIGDVLVLSTKGGGKWSWDGKVIEHLPSPDDEAADVAARQHFEANKIAKRNAGKSDLDDALLPLRRAYQQVPVPQRAAFIAWAVREMMGWGR